MAAYLYVYVYVCVHVCVYVCVHVCVRADAQEQAVPIVLARLFEDFEHG